MIFLFAHLLFLNSPAGAFPFSTQDVHNRMDSFADQIVGSNPYVGMARQGGGYSCNPGDPPAPPTPLEPLLGALTEAERAWDPAIQSFSNVMACARFFRPDKLSENQTALSPASLKQLTDFQAELHKYVADAREALAPVSTPPPALELASIDSCSAAFQKTLEVTDDSWRKVGSATSRIAYDASAIYYDEARLHAKREEQLRKLALLNRMHSYFNVTFVTKACSEKYWSGRKEVEQRGLAVSRAMRAIQDQYLNAASHHLTYSHNKLTCLRNKACH